MQQYLRRLPLQGTQNTRDLGGYPCAGGSTRWGVFLRSDNPGRLTAADFDFLKAYGVTTAVDLRRADENEVEPSGLAPAGGFCVHNVSLNDDIANIDFEGDLPGSMAGLYIALLENNAPQVAQVVRLLAAAQGGALFHCAVGKDRTGVIAMLLLALAGADEKDIIADYAVTDIYRDDALRQQAVVFNGVTIGRHVLLSKPASMRRTLHHLQQRHGTARQYLLGAGVAPDELDALLHKFVQPL